MWGICEFFVGRDVFKLQFIEQKSDKLLMNNE